jgi:hypothetical protein
MEVLILLATAFGMMLFVLFVSAILEAVVEFAFGIPADYVPWLTKNKGWMTPLVAVIIAMVASFIYRLDILFIYGQFIDAITMEIAGVHLDLGIVRTWYGIATTGMIIARGSSWVHEFFKRFFKFDARLKDWSAFGEPEPKS